MKHAFSIWCIGLLLVGCTSTRIVESPKTAFVPDTGPRKDPQIYWTSRQVNRSFGYLGKITARSWSYEGAIERIIQGGRELRADAVIDVHYEQVGFLTSMQAFAVKFQ